MSLRLASLDALIAISAALAPGWYDNSKRLDDCFDRLADARRDLRTAIGISSLNVEFDEKFDAITLAETVGAHLSHNPETALLAGAIIRAIGQHRAETLTKTLLAAE